MANALLDFLQGASNSAAANVSAPVDGIAWLLRKAGINVDRPVMGSDWMRERGLTAEPTNKLAGILGESVGGVLPMVTAAKAPQIAQGLLQAERNLAAPRTLDPQAGAILWHGSPHKFDAFDASKIGTGEGAQAYGHGLYLAESPDVAKQYQAALSSPEYSSKGRTLKGNEAWAAQFLHDFSGDALPKRRSIEKAINRANSVLNDTPTKQEILKYISTLDKNGVDVVNGSLYKVDLPDEHIAKMLDWDKLLSEQPPEVQNAAMKLAGGKLQDLASSQHRYLPTVKPLDTMTGEEFIRTLNNGARGSTEQILQKQGIPGIRYLDGGSRGTGAGTSNYVVFPGNEGLLSILERNGQPLK